MMANMYILDCPYIQQGIKECPEYAYYLAFQERQSMNILSYKLFEYIYGFGSLQDYLSSSWTIDSIHASSRLDSCYYSYYLRKEIRIALSIYSVPDEIVWICAEFAINVPNYVNSSYLNEIRCKNFDLSTKVGSMLWDYCHVSQFVEHSKEATANILKTAQNNKNSISLIKSRDIPYVAFIQKQLKHYHNNGMLVQTFCEESISYHDDIAYVYHILHNKSVINIIFEFNFGPNWKLSVLEFLPHAADHEQNKTLVLLPAEFDDLIIVQNTKYNEKEVKYSPPNWSRFLDCDAKYLLSSAHGAKLWEQCNVYQFVKECPCDAYNIAQEYSNLLETYGSYHAYELLFGFGSFYEDICTLSYTDSNLLQDLCQFALKHMLPN